MNALLAKEIRLLLPAYAAGLLLAVLSGWLRPAEPWAVLPLLIGIVLVALTVFGREFALNTFPMILAQPQERVRTWWTKIGVLGVAVLTLLVTWAAVGMWSSTGRGAAVHDEGLIEGVMLILMVLVTGLGTTLLLRQVIAAFWFTLLVPVAIVALFGRSPAVLIVISLMYSAAGFVWAWRYYLRLQETPWTGGVVALPGRASAAKAERAGLRSPRPLAALIVKELQLQNLCLLGIACLFLLHIGVLFVRKAGLESFGYSARSALEAFGGIWLLVPFILSATAVAEERKLGTADGLRSLPVSAKVQFDIKFLLVLVVGGLVSPLLLWTAEAIGRAIGAPANIGGLDMTADPWVLRFLCVIFLGLSLVSFYGATLARNVVQALVAGFLVGFIVWQVGLMPSRFDYYIREAGLWEGFLVHYIAWPVLTVVFVRLAWSNFKCGGESRHFWWRNLVGLPAAFLGIGLVTMAIYNRVWEFVVPLEPAHGPPRLSLRAPPKLGCYGNVALTAVLPERGLWVNRMWYEAGDLILDVAGDQTGFRIGGEWIDLDLNPFIPGTNWVDAVASAGETVALQSDGSLWVSAKPRSPMREEPRLAREAVPPLVRFGADSGWQQVVRDLAGSVVLLKRDGTLWRWRWAVSSPGEKRPPGLRHSRPYRLGTDSDWARMIKVGASIHLWKQNGTAWALRSPRYSEVQLEPDTVPSRCPAFDNEKWSSAVRCWPLEAGVRDDGTLWAWTIAVPDGNYYREEFRIGKPAQIGKDTNWVAVAGEWGALVGLKADGSLWRFKMADWSTRPIELAALAAQRPGRLGRHNDWVAIDRLWNGTVSVAADGSLWYWSDRTSIYNSPQPMISAPRKPLKLANLLPRRAR